jgi:hypothetical protein
MLGYHIINIIDLSIQPFDVGLETGLDALGGLAKPVQLSRSYADQLISTIDECL